MAQFLPLLGGAASLGMGAAGLIANGGKVWDALKATDKLIGDGLDAVIGVAENVVGINNNAVSNKVSQNHIKNSVAVAARTHKRKRAGDLSFGNNNEIVILPSYSNEIKHHFTTQELIAWQDYHVSNENLLHPSKFVLNEVTLGTNFDNRIGRKINMIGLKLNMRFKYNGLWYNQIKDENALPFFRVILFMDKSPNNSGFSKTYVPNPENVEAYGEIYQSYVKLGKFTEEELYKD